MKSALQVLIFDPELFLIESREHQPWRYTASKVIVEKLLTVHHRQSAEPRLLIAHLKCPLDIFFLFLDWEKAGRRMWAQVRQGPKRRVGLGSRMCKWPHGDPIAAGLDGWAKRTGLGRWSLGQGQSQGSGSPYQWEYRICWALSTSNWLIRELKSTSFPTTSVTLTGSRPLKVQLLPLLVFSSSFL